MVYVPDILYNDLDRKYGLGQASVDLFAGYVSDHSDEEAQAYVHQATNQRLSGEQAREVVSLLRQAA